MVLVDANIVLELLLPNRRKVLEVTAVLGSADKPCISALTAHLVWHFGRLERLNDGLIAEHVAAYELLPLTSTDYAWAVANEQSKDFEDALQVAVALANSCEQFITLDRQLAKRYAHLPLDFIIA